MKICKSLNADVVLASFLYADELRFQVAISFRLSQFAQIKTVEEFMAKCYFFFFFLTKVFRRM